MVFYIVKIYQTVFVSKKIKAKNLDQSFKPEIPDVLTCKPEIPDVLTCKPEIPDVLTCKNLSKNLIRKKKNQTVKLPSIYLLVCLSVCLFPINVKTAEPIGPKLFVGLGPFFSFLKMSQFEKKKLSNVLEL